MPIDAIRPLIDIPTGFLADQRRARRQGRRSRRCSGSSRARSGPGATGQDAAGVQRGGQAAAQRAQPRPLLLLGRRAVRRRLPDPQLVQHDRAAADARDRHAAHARRLARPGHADDPDRGADHRRARQRARPRARDRARQRADRADARHGDAGRCASASRAGPAIVAVVIGMLVTAAGALWPARRAGRVSPIRAVLGTRGVAHARRGAARLRVRRSP